MNQIQTLLKEYDSFHPGLAVVCVILGFHNGTLKVLLNNYYAEFDFWRLPGSFVLKNENIDDAVQRILYEQTGLSDIYLRQYYTFGDNKRVSSWRIDTVTSESGSKNYVKITNRLSETDPDQSNWNTGRFVTIGYYALLDFTRVKIIPEREHDIIEWKEINQNIIYFGDHKLMIEKALEVFQSQLSVIPIGKELLPDKFTMSELRELYEAILGRSLDRRNFQRKILSLGYVEKLNEQRKGGAHKAPALFCFNEKKYQETQIKGLGVNW